MSISNIGASALFAPVTATTSLQLAPDTLDQFGGTGSFDFFDRLESIEDIVNILGQDQEQTFSTSEPANSNAVQPTTPPGTEPQQGLDLASLIGGNVDIFA